MLAEHGCAPSFLDCRAGSGGAADDGIRGSMPSNMVIRTVQMTAELSHGSQGKDR
ncbi:MAG: hypothetical protein IPK27_23405 [Rhodanobacteraceae bacterium]|nr:hypothetical protein [Rhodanobacteraceae bacterium]